MGFAQTHLGGFFRRIPLRTPRTCLRGIYGLIFLVGADFVKVLMGFAQTHFGTFKNFH